MTTTCLDFNSEEEGGAADNIQFESLLQEELHWEGLENWLCAWNGEGQ